MRACRNSYPAWCPLHSKEPQDTAYERMYAALQSRLGTSQSVTGSTICYMQQCNKNIISTHLLHAYPMPAPGDLILFSRAVDSTNRSRYTGVRRVRSRGDNDSESVRDDRRGHKIALERQREHTAVGVQWVQCHYSSGFCPPPLDGHIPYPSRT